MAARTARAAQHARRARVAAAPREPRVLVREIARLVDLAGVLTGRLAMIAAVHPTAVLVLHGGAVLKSEPVARVLRCGIQLLGDAVRGGVRVHPEASSVAREGRVQLAEMNA